MPEGQWSQAALEEGGCGLDIRWARDRAGLRPSLVVGAAPGHGIQPRYLPETGETIRGGGESLVRLLRRNGDLSH